MARLQEAKRHIPPTPQDRLRQRKREERAAERAHYLANKEAIDAEQGKWLEMVTTKALAILHQKVNALQVAEEAASKIGSTLRIRLPVSYRINDNE